MNRKQFAICVALISSFVGVMAVYGASTGNILPVLIAFGIGLFLSAIIKRKVTEILEDERIYKISEKASRRTLQILSIGMATTGAGLIILDKYPEVGYTLAFSACILILLYMIFYGYYSRKNLE